MALSSNPYTRHTLPQVLERAWYLFWLEPTAFFGLGLAVVGPLLLLNSLLLMRLRALLDENIPSSNNSYNDAGIAIGELRQHAQGLFRQFIVGIFVFGLLAVLVKAATIRTAIQVYLQQGQNSVALNMSSIFQNLCHGLKRLGTIVCWSGVIVIVGIFYFIAMGLVISTIVTLARLMGGNALAIITNRFLILVNFCFCYYVSLILVFCLPAIVLEGSSAIGSLSRAWTMAEGHRCMVFCTQMMILLGTILVLLAEAWVLYIVGLSSNAVALMIVHTVNHLFLIPFGCIVATVLYLNVRIVKEGLNRDVLVREFQGTDGGDGSLPAASLELENHPVPGNQLRKDYAPVLLKDEEYGALRRAMDEKTITPGIV